MTVMIVLPDRIVSCGQASNDSIADFAQPNKMSTEP